MSSVSKRVVWIAALFCVFVLLPGIAWARYDPSSRSGPAPTVSLAAPASGEAAVAALGPKIADVAREHGLTPQELTKRFKSDGSLVVDTTGRLFYSDPGLPSSAPLATTDAALALPVPLADTFKLHSLPGAKRVVFLDFDGHVISGTAWNNTARSGGTIYAPAWDIEGGPSVFTAQERTIIQRVWQRVAEDYAPFNVDVTTEFPGESAITRSSLSDEYYGMRVLISPISSKVGPYGGVAYVGVFDMVGDYYKPALVFPENLANNEKYVGEAATHENGHTLGLGHDGLTNGTEYYQGRGSGETGWAPIMGTAYYRNLSQWSKGDYVGANNHEDDLAVMQTHGIPYRADDHGDSPVAATTLPSVSAPTASGMIGRPGDVDVFALQAGTGPLSVSVTPADWGADLDVLVELRDSAGTLLASSNPVDLLAASLSTTVTAGTYYVYVKGTGKGDASTGYPAYGSLGVYTLSASVSSGPQPPVAVASATPDAGDAPLSVQFDGSGSYDPDGGPVTYAWAFGDGGAATTSAPVHVYTSAAAYTATLTVTDDEGQSASTSVVVTVRPPNQPPAAVAVGTPTSGAAPLPVAFDGSGSSDPDGHIVSYAWSFGDGAGGTGATVSHTYQAAGDYVATLTVTDDRGATAQATVSVHVTVNPLSVLRVASISMSAVTDWTSRTGKSVQALVTVTNSAGTVVSGVTVTGTWNGVATGLSSGLTSTLGTTTLTKTYAIAGTATFTVTGLAKIGYSYNPALNGAASASIILK